MNWQYALRWNDLLGDPMDLLTEEEARARHEKGELYTAYRLGGDGVMDAAVEVCLASGYVGVRHFDEQGRLDWSRTLSRRGSRMFMEDATWYDYGDTTGHMLPGQAEGFYHVHLEPDGTGYEHHRVAGEPVREQVIFLKDDAALAEFWAPVPGFGEYTEACLAGVEHQRAEEVRGECEREQHSQSWRG